MSDVLKAVTTAYGVMGLKPRSAQSIIDTLKSKGVEATDSNGFLSLSQGSTQFNVAEALQATFKQHPELFHGHSGEICYKSDIPAGDVAARTKYINDFGYDAWAALPANEKSPTAKNVVKAAIASTEMTRKEWLDLTIPERSQAIGSWGQDGPRIVGEIMNRRK